MPTGGVPCGRLPRHPESSLLSTIGDSSHDYSPIMNALFEEEGFVMVKSNWYSESKFDTL